MTVSLNKITSNLGISWHSVQNIVKKELGLHSYRLLQGQMLMETAKENRLQKAKKLLKHLAVSCDQRMLFTEKIFAMEVARNSQNHHQLLSLADRRSCKHRICTKMLFPKSVMVWGGITATGKTSLMFIDKGDKINVSYCQEEILKKVACPWTSQHFPGFNMILLQDWTPVHGVKSTLDHLFLSHLRKDLWPWNSHGVF